ncbi:hypothetical protein M406DRAFT_40675 [Cryphonectria parasitica EP155]|uniref:AB hydrolase-1 domain-containing protein n=1 Tax=Cryphonectria parasitica (strain ATCC 38755 / EP155) TaxID=660469 RepID=A0A9P4Y7L7_CRYP1|nr:uncharacterized protein M406DRAFT_40675 [Cryphonectria parasitica EP155]KAF3767924.1 hypothetical protein M406DRAFT_40675 [Cryphonectria parasitica EP155]
MLLSRVSAAQASVRSTAKECITLEVPIPVSATNYYIDLPRIDNNIDAVDCVWNLTTWSHGADTTRITGPHPVNGTFTINAQLCVPPQGKKLEILQLATHGIGFDMRYWDVQMNPEEYSYVNSALSYGYSILTYDRLGTGKSSKPDAYDVLQAGVEIEIVRGLTELVRAGKLISSSKIVNTTGNGTTALDDYTPSKVVHVGHSYGSFMTSGLLSNYGNLSDGAILTGFLISPHLLKEVTPATFGFEFAPESDPARFADFLSGYVVQKTESNIQQIFLKKGSFEPEMLSYAEEIKQPAVVAELVSGAQVLAQPAVNFSGPLQIFVGEFDYPNCDGDCNGVWSIQNISAVYPAASNISVYLQPGTGHGLTMSTNATAGYEVMFSYLDSHGL